MRKSKEKEFVLGLALGSGGAKGFAHLGAIKAFEEEGIEFDLVAGTSIGSVVGSFYAKGYSSDDILNLVQESQLLNPQTIFSFTFGLISLQEVMSQLLGGADFSDLKKPFKVLSVDVDKGKEEVLDSGDLASALASSCAVPPLRPINRDGKMLVDGAFLNSVPADIVKDMGADFVVSINLGKESPTNQTIKRGLDEIYPNNKIPLKNRSEKCYEYSDFVIEPDLSQYSAMAVSQVEQMYQIGYEEVKKSIKEIKNAITNKRKG